ncbi:putative ankyrin repeat-containing domain-containing protein [Helianthus anomalus]
MFGIESVPDRKRLLYKAAVEGCWWKAKSILKVNENAATEAVTANGNTILHLAVEMGHNYFVEKLLEFLKDEEGIETQNNKGRTALYSAARVGNDYAAQLLVQKRKELLLIKDSNGESPLDSANMSNKFNISTYLLKTAPPSSWKAANRAIQTAIIGKQYGEWLVVGCRSCQLYVGL